jgi:NAD(P)-dependent dehydrogenase (short-subunit alcohol dehydrogenase family)
VKRRDILRGLAFAAAGASGSVTRAQVVPAAPTTASRWPLKSMRVDGATVLVTGSNQGIGLGFVKALLARGAKRVYATARREESLPDVVALDPGRVRALVLDVNEPEQRQRAAAQATDVTWLINNAGVPGSRTRSEDRILAAASLDDGHWVMQTNCWSPAELCRLFAPIIVKNGGGAITNILSVGAWYCVPQNTTYSMSKAAAAMMTAGVRAELDREPVLVSGVYTAGVATNMSGGQGMDPVAHAHLVLDAAGRGETDILAGTGVERLRDAVRADPKAVERERIERMHAAGE